MRRCRSLWGARVCWLAVTACAVPEDLPGGDAASGGSGGGSNAGSGGGGASSGAGSGGKLSVAGAGNSTTGGASSGGSAGSGGSTTAGNATAGSNSGGSATGGSTAGGKGGAAGQSGSAGKGGTSGSGGSASGGASGTELFFENFENGATKWAATTTDWSIVTDGSNQVYEQSAKSNQFRMAAATGGPWDDQIIEARMKIVSIATGSTSYYAAVCGRVQDATHYYYIAVRANGTLVIRARKGSEETSLTSEADSVITPGTWHTIRFELVGTMLRASIDGMLLVTATDADIARGGVGLGNRNASVQYDDVRVRAP